MALGPKLLRRHITSQRVTHPEQKFDRQSRDMLDLHKSFNFNLPNSKSEQGIQRVQLLRKE